MFETSRPYLVGDAGVVKQTIEILSLDCVINVVDDPREGNYEPGIINMKDLKNIDIDAFPLRRSQRHVGSAAFEYIKEVVDMAMAGQVDAIATTPINKESFHAGKVSTSVTRKLSGSFRCGRSVDHV